MIKYLIIFLTVLIVITAVSLVFLAKKKPNYEIARIGINGKIFEAFKYSRKIGYLIFYVTAYSFNESFNIFSKRIHSLLF